VPFPFFSSGIVNLSELRKSELRKPELRKRELRKPELRKSELFESRKSMKSGKFRKSRK